MGEFNRLLNKEKISLLRSLIGEKMEKYRRDEYFLGNGTVIGNVEFFVKGKVYAITDYPDWIPFFWGDETVCDIDFKEIKPEAAISYCKDTSQIDIPIDKEIKDVVIVNDRIEQYEEDKLENTYDFVRAIIFVFDDVEMGFEREIWMQEFLLVHKGSDVVSMLQDPYVELSEWIEGQKSVNTRTVVHLKQS